MHQNFGSKVQNRMIKLMKAKRISILKDCQITKMDGENKLETIHFRDAKNQAKTKMFTSEGIVEYTINPDMVIVENGLGPPKVELGKCINNKDAGALQRIALDFTNGMPSSNIRFSLLHNDTASCLYAAGSTTQFPSFFHKVKVRPDDVRFNVESGFFAAMSMLDKRMEFKYIPMTNLKLGGKQIYFVGERGQAFTEIITSGDVDSGKYVVFYAYGDEICGFVTVGYQNLHLYLWQAMKNLQMPTAAMIREADGDLKSIVAGVLNVALDIES